MPFWGTIEYKTDGNTGHTTGVDIGAEWNSGELVEIYLDDNDMNFDARSQEQMTTGSNASIVPAVKIGSPITITGVNTIQHGDNSASGTLVDIDSAIDDTQCSSDYGAAGTAASYVSCYEKYSERAVITFNSAVTLDHGDALEFTYDGTTVDDLADLISGANGTSAYT
jgi:acetyltransferase-like isoleucine patch superfamily enzyme